MIAEKYTLKYTLKQWMGLRELNQTTLSQATGLSVRTINELANDPEKLSKARYPTLKAIAKALDIDIQDIRGLD